MTLQACNRQFYQKEVSHISDIFVNLVDRNFPEFTKLHLFFHSTYECFF